jgi:hypothetical protein
MSDSVWQPDNVEWMDHRKCEWEAFGKNILQAMTEADCFRYGRATPDDFQNYFFTGFLPEDFVIPVHFKIMFHPVENDVDFIEACINGTDDKKIKDILRISDRSYYKNNKSFARFYCSEAFTERLKKLDLLSFRDNRIIDSPTFSRILGAYKDPEDLHLEFDVHLLNDYLPAALRCVQSEKDSKFGSVEYLMRKSAHFIEPTGLPGEDTVAKRYAETFYHKFEHEIPKEHVLYETWQAVKNCRFKLTACRWKDEEYSEEELREIIEDYSVEFESEPSLVPSISRYADDYVMVLSALVKFFKEYDICEETEPFDTWAPVDIARLLSSGAKSFFSLDQHSVLAYRYSFIISNCAFKSRKMDPAEQDLISLFVIPEKHEGVNFQRASILSLQLNGNYQLDYDFPSDIKNVYGHLLKWLNAREDAGFYSYWADHYGQTEFTQEERDQALNSGIRYEGFDLLTEDVNYFDQELSCVISWGDSNFPNLNLELS